MVRRHARGAQALAQPAHGKGFGSLPADDSDRFLKELFGQSVLSALIGIAVTDGLIGSIDDPVTKYLPGMKDPRFSKMTFRHCSYFAINSRAVCKWLSNEAKSKGRMPNAERCRHLNVGHP